MELAWADIRARDTAAKRCAEEAFQPLAKARRERLQMLRRTCQVAEKLRTFSTFFEVLRESTLSSGLCFFDGIPNPLRNPK